MTRVSLLCMLYCLLSGLVSHAADTTIYGKALNAKYRAVVMTADSHMYYLEEIERWPANVLNKSVKVTGVVFIRKFPAPKPGDPIMARITGPVLMIKKVTYEVRAD